MSLVSIIVPFYNSESHLQKCVDSILAQTLADIECILVDDGSTDNSSMICKDYMINDIRVKYHYQDNSGPAAARNNGVKKSESNLVMFVDADDWIESNTIETFYAAYKKSNVDMVISTAYNFISDGFLYHRQTKEIDISVQSPLVYYLSSECIKSNWNKLMRKHLWENLYIPEKSNFEDFITGVQIFSKIPQNMISCINVPVYNQICDTTIKTLSYIGSDDYNKPFELIKQVAVFDWIENYIAKLQEDNMSLVYAAFAWLFMHYMGFPYLIASRYVSRRETRMFWEYYQKSILIWKYPVHHKILISTYHNSLIVGRIIQFLYRFMRCVYIRLCRLFQ